jgi:hypothetical protein
MLLTAFTAGTPTSAAELLNSTQLIQEAKNTFAFPMVMALPDLGSSSPVGFTPIQIRDAYGLGPVGASNITFGAGIQGDGSNQTIAIVDAYDDPTAASDLHNFDVQFGLPDPPSFTKVNENGQASPLPGTDPGGAFNVTGNLSWEVEESLDIEWSHVMAPQAKIVLVECDSPSLDDLTITGAATAGTLAGVSVVSMSFGEPELTTEENLFDQLFFTPASHNGVTYFASTGDDGSPSGSPAYSQAVVAVGGTSLTIDGSNNYVSESGWSGSGGGIADAEYQPSFQTPFFTSTTRTAPDVSMVADPATGVAIYDSFDFGAGTPWIRIGGTSLSSPLWAGLGAVVNQGRVVHGLLPLDGAGQTLPLIYGLPASDFHDVTTGSNGGFSAGSGYDLVTGRGSPIANLLVPALASAAAPTLKPDLQPFQNFEQDTNTLWSGPVVLSTQSGVHSDPAMINAGDPIFLNATWYNDSETGTTKNFLVDFNMNGQDLGSATATGGLPSLNLESITDASLGNFQAGFTTITMSIDSGHAVSESTETNNTWSRTYDINSASSQNYVLKLDPTGNTVQVLINNVLSFSTAKSSMNELSFYLSGSNDTVTVDSTNGNPLPLQGLTVNGNAGSNDTLTINGTSSKDAIDFANGQVSLDTVPVNYANMASVTINAGGGTDSLEVDGFASVANTMSIGTSQFTLNGQLVNYSNVETMTILTGTGDDVLTQLSTPSATVTFAMQSGNDIFNVNGGSYTFSNDAINSLPSFGLGTDTLTVNVASGASVIFGATQHLSALNLNGGTATLAANGSRTIVLNGLSASGGGTLDLEDNALILHGGSLVNFTSLIDGGYALGAWNGQGIDSSFAAAHPGSAIGFGPAGSIFGSFPTTFLGQTVSSSSDILARFTIVGDANLDRIVTTTDFTMLAGNFAGAGTAFSQGNFNFDNNVNAIDFNALATNFGQQSLTAVLPGPPLGDVTMLTAVPNLFSVALIGGNQVIRELI